jgi:predicted flap endonuclease-1-like 5' DNA nuclease
MQYQDEHPERRIAYLVISFSLIAIAVGVWWQSTVLAVLLLVLGTVILVNLICTRLLVSVQPLQPTQSRTTRKGVPRERSVIETRIARAIQEELQSGQKRKRAPKENFLNELDRAIPPKVLNGVGPEISEKLEQMGINDLESLADADAVEIAEACNVDPKTAIQWVFDAEALCHGADITDIIELSVAEPEEVVLKISEALVEDIIGVPKDYELTIDRVAHWINEANAIVSAVDVEEIKRTIEKGEK